MLITFTFELKVATKLFKRSFLSPHFDLTALNALPHFLRKWFHFVTQKFAKDWKLTFWSAQNIRFWAQGSFKILFYEVLSDQILI